MDLIKITPDTEKAKNILKMISLLEERIQQQDKERMSALIITDYYEIIKELKYFSKAELKNINVFPKILKEKIWEEYKKGFPQIKFIGIETD